VEAGIGQQEAVLRQVLAADPLNVPALLGYAALFIGHGRFDIGRLLLRQAAAAAPASTEAWAYLSANETSAGRWNAARQYARRMSRLNPLDVAVHYRGAAELFHRGDIEGCEIALRRAMIVDPAHPETLALRAFLCLRRGEYRRGFRFFAERWRIPALAELGQVVPRPYWTGSNPRGRTIAVFSEQGHGDTLMCLRYLEMLKARGARVVVVAAPELARLLRSLPFVDTVVPRGAPLPAFDGACLMFSLPALLDVPDRSPPHCVVPADPDATAAWRARMDPARINVGLAWSGNPGHKLDHLRSVPLDQLRPLFAVPGIAWHSLQVGARGDDIPALAPGRIVDHRPDIADFADTAALMSALDLVITVDSAPAHLAGILGRPAWIMTYEPTDWRWGMAGDGSDWYPSLRIFRQRTAGRWDDVVAALAVALADIQITRGDNDGRL